MGTLTTNLPNNALQCYNTQIKTYYTNIEINEYKMRMQPSAEIIGVCLNNKISNNNYHNHLAE